MDALKDFAHSQLIVKLRQTLIKSLSNHEHIENKAFNLKLKKSCALINVKLGWELRTENKKLYVTKKELAKEGVEVETV